MTSLYETKQDEYGTFFVDSQGKDKEIRIYQETLTDEYYILKIDTNAVNTSNSFVRTKEYIEIKNVPVLAKVDMKANTVLTQNLVVQSNERLTDDTRTEEYNVVVLPMDLMTDDYIDIRLMTPNGQNFIVLSKVRVEVPINADGTYVADTIRVQLREDERLAMSSAIVEAAGIPGAKLYANKYVEPAMQKESTTTYIPNAEVTQQLGPKLDGNNRLIGFENPNIIETAEKALIERYDNAAIQIRNNYLQQQINNNEDYQQDVQSEMDNSIGTSTTVRKKYLESLNY